MGKYIIDIDDKYINSNNELIILHKNPFDKCSYHVKAEKITPYTELDTEEFYLRGLNDAWKAAQKIDGMKREQQEEIFACDGIQFIALDFSISEIIEKILAYEKKQEGEKLSEIEKVLEATALKCHVSYADIAKALEKMGVNKND